MAPTETTAAVCSICDCYVYLSIFFLVCVSLWLSFINSCFSQFFFIHPHFSIGKSTKKKRKMLFFSSTSSFRIRSSSSSLTFAAMWTIFFSRRNSPKSSASPFPGAESSVLGPHCNASLNADSFQLCNSAPAHQNVGINIFKNSVGWSARLFDSWRWRGSVCLFVCYFSLPSGWTHIT